MDTLRLISLVILAGLAIGLFAIAYPKIRGMSTTKEAKETADKINSNIEHLLTTGGTEYVDIKIPNGYKLTFENHQLSINNIELPKNRYPIQIQGPSLSPGEYTLKITLKDNKISIEVPK